MGGSQSTRIYNVAVSEKKEGESQIFRNPLHKDQLLFEPLPGIDTLQALILRGYTENKNSDFLGAKNPTTNQYEYITYETVMNKIKGLGSALTNLSLVREIKEYKQFSIKPIGVYAKNRVEWTIADMTNAMYGYTMIPLYDTLGPESISYVLGHSKITTCYCSEQSIHSLSKTKDLHDLKNIISFDIVSEELKNTLAKKGVQIYNFEEVIAKGSEKFIEFPKLNSENIFTFSYTSGTTGPPKGAMLSHRNILSAVSNHQNSDIKYFSTDTHLSYLPLPHILERFVCVTCWFTGTKIAFYSGDLLKLKDDLAAAKPTVLISVPRLLNRFYEGIVAKLNEAEGFKKTLINYALKTKLENISSNGEVKHMLYDALIFDKVKEVFGGRVRVMATGSAPLSPKILDFFKAILSCNVLEGYGQTEACGLETIQVNGDVMSGNVGGIMPSMELKLVDVPDMNYFSTDKDEVGNSLPRGEICVRGHSVIPSYYKDEEKTKESIDDEGWLHSGDIGCILQNGGLKIIDRKKNIFKLSQGEYISPEKVENVYIRARGVQEAFVDGDSLFNFCVAVIVPNPVEILKIATELSINETNLEQLCKNPAIIAFYLKTVNEFGKQEGLFTFEQPQRIYLEPQSLMIHGCYTSSFKLQRHHAKVHFKEVIQQLYKQ